MSLITHSMQTENFINASRNCVPIPKGMGNKPHLLWGFDINNMQEEQEIWKDVIMFEGYYQISNLGNVRSLDRIGMSWNGNMTYKRFGKIMKPTPNPDGYLKVDMMRKPLDKCFFVHRLVAIHFVPNPLNKREVNHIDGNKLNNCHNNLEWCTRKENMQHACRTGLKNGMIGSVNPNSKRVVNTITGKQYCSAREAFEDYKKYSYRYFRAMLYGKNRNTTEYKYL